MNQRRQGAQVLLRHPTHPLFLRSRWIEKTILALAALCAVAVMATALKQKHAAGDGGRVMVLEMHWLKPGASLDDVNAYMRELRPILARHGARHIEEFGVMQPDLLGGLSFASEADFQALLSDPDFQRLAEMREDTFDLSRGLMFRIEHIDPTAATLSARGAWNSAESEGR